MKVVFICSYYSSFKSSVFKNIWAPEGMPSVFKLFDILRSQSIEYTVIFCPKDSNSKSLQLKKLDVGDRSFYLLSGGKSSKYFEIFNDYHVYRVIRNEIIGSDSDTILYCDRANIKIGSLFAHLTDIPVFLRLHGITTWYVNASSVKWIIANIFTWLSFKAPYKAVLCSEDGTPGSIFLSKYFKSKNLYTWLNGVDKSKASSNYSLKIGNLDSLLFVSRLDSTKGVEKFLDLAKRIISLKINIKIVMIGDGPLRYLVEDFIEKLRFGHNFHFLGSVEHSRIKYYYENSSIFVSYNDLGNLSNTMLEALANGCIPITFEPCARTLRDVSTRNLLKEVAFYVKRDNSIEESLRIIEDLANNDQMFHARMRRVEEFAQSYLRTWDDRIKSELDLLMKVV